MVVVDFGERSEEKRQEEQEVDGEVRVRSTE